MNTSNPFNERREKFLTEFPDLESIGVKNKVAKRNAKRKKSFKQLRDINERRNEQNEIDNSYDTC